MCCSCVVLLPALQTRCFSSSHFIPATTANAVPFFLFCADCWGSVPLVVHACLSLVFGVQACNSAYAQRADPGEDRHH